MKLQVFCVMVAAIGIGPATWADNEASNHAQVSAGQNGRCYAKSIPDHVYDPDDARQAGRTDVFVVSDTEDQLVRTYDWFGQQLFLLCDLASDDSWIVRLGPWHRGHNPRPDHLAIAFYHRGVELRSYSTLEIAGDAPSETGEISDYKNVSASVSHYSVFQEPPTLTQTDIRDGAIFRNKWLVVATTIDGRQLVFDAKTGELSGD